MSGDASETGSSAGSLMQGLQAGRKGTADEVFRGLYPELRRMAAARMRRERSGHSWQPTLLVNELYLELLKNRALDGVVFTEEQRNRFLGLAGFLMNRLLILHSRPLRQRVAATGEDDLRDVPTSEAGPESLQFVESLLSRIEAIDPRLRTVVELRVFEGKTAQEIAEQMGCSSRTVNTWWAFARQWLETELGPQP